MKKMGHNKTVILVTTGLLLLAGIFFYTVYKDARVYRSGVSQDIVVEQTWELPKILREVSGIAFLEPHRIACIQDEKGVIFIYDLESSSIVKEVEFAGPGDYEGITLDGNTAYILKSDGSIYRVKDFLGEATTEVFETPFSSKNDVEGLYYDPGDNHLLVVPKGRGLNSRNHRGIHVVNVSSMKMESEPLKVLTFQEDLFNNLKGNDEAASFYPSEIVRHPETGELLMLEATRPHLLILDYEGQPKELHRLDPDLFPKPEGLTFDSSGNLYISNEGNPATIHRVSIK